MATVVHQEGELIRMVSGNAGGAEDRKGSVRIEETTREVPPADYSCGKVIAVAREINAIQDRVDTIFVALEQSSFPPGSAEEAQLRLELEILGRKRDRKLKELERIEKRRPGEGHSWVVVVEHTGQLHPQLLSALNSGTLKSEHNLARFGQAGAPGGFGGPARTPPFSVAQEFPANDL